MYSICNCFGEFNSIGDIGIDDSVLINEVEVVQT